MDPRELRECQEGNTGDAQGRRRRMVLDIDLNHCPPDENIFNSLGNQGQATNVIEVVDDDDVVVISPRKFAEATQNSRRNHRLLDGSLEDCLVISDHRPGNPDPRTALRPELLWNTPLRRAQNLANTLTPTPTFTCGICMDELTEETSTKCGHIFCKKCIDAAIAAQHKCPSCRQKLNKRDTLRVYLPKSG